uniref:Uncharacterized protein n=1 Tax=Cannabis sativa TaxID=3483 RepID=A0A803R2Q5_CANSA
MLRRDNQLIVLSRIGCKSWRMFLLSWRMFWMIVKLRLFDWRRVLHKTIHGTERYNLLYLV